MPAAEPVFSRQTAQPAARVVIASNPGATVAFRPQSATVDALVERGIFELSGKTNFVEAWQKFVSTNDVIGIKIYSAPGENSGTRAEVVSSMINQLISAGIATNHIIIWDRDMRDLRLAGFVDLAARLHVKIAASATTGYDEAKCYDNPLIGNLIWGDLEFGRKGSSVGRKSFVTKIASREITKIISIAPLLNHNLAGTTGHLYSLAFGSVDNTQRFEYPERIATALPEIYALPSLSDKVVLNITDALLCQYEGEQRTLLHYSTALNEIWFSRDPVALDVLAINEINRQRELAKIAKNKSSMETYENAELLELGVGHLEKIQIERTP